MFWSIYIVASILISLVLSRLSKNHSSEVFIFFLTVLITPTQMDTLPPEYAPSVFTFIFNMVFEQNFSTKALRPILLTTPLILFFIFLRMFIKRKFF